MELGLFTSGYQRYPLEQTFEDANRFGYDYIELWGGYPHAYVEDLAVTGTGAIDRLIQKYHMPVKCFTPEHNGSHSEISHAGEVFYTGAQRLSL